MTTTTADIKSAAQLERQRLAGLAAQARAALQSQAEQAQAETETQARQAIAETERQVQVAKTQAQQQAESRQAQIRKQRGAAEREAQAAMARARRARNIEQRKIVLPITKPRDLGTASYIANVESARKQAHQAGEDAKAAVTRVRDDYFRQVDKARDDAIANIQSQKTGIVRDVQIKTVAFNADITKQLAQLNSGVDTWEAKSNTAIARAQADYEAAIKAALDRNGTDVFADMKGKGLIPATAVYDSYDKTTGQLNYTVPDSRSGEEIFADLQSQNKIPPNATYKGYNNNTGEVSYSVQTPRFGSNVFLRMQNAGKIPKDAAFVSYNATNKTVTYFIAGRGTTTSPGTLGITPSGNSTVATTPSSATAGPSSNTANVVAGSIGIMAAAGGIIEVGGALASIPTPPTWLIGGAVATFGLVVGLIRRKQIVDNWKRLTGQGQSTANQAADAVVTNQAGTAVYRIQQFTTTGQAKGQNIESIPHAGQLAQSLTTPNVNIKPISEGIELKSHRLETEGIPRIKGAPTVMIRDPFDVPELKQKASNVLQAALATQQVATSLARLAVKERVLTREQYERLQALEGLTKVKERVITGEEYGKLAALRERYLRPGADISQSYRLAYQDYLRKKAILDAARKAYVESLNPRPVKGRGSADAKAAAIGVWLAQDVMQAAIQKSLAKGESMEGAMTAAQGKVQELSKELGLSHQQINAASATVVYQVALSTMAQEAIKAASQAQTKGLTQTQLQTQTLTATKQAVQTIVQTAVDTQTITQTQANEMTRSLEREAEAVTELTLKIKLPKPGTKESPGAEKEKYPDGTVVWSMGNLRGKGDEYKIIPPPYDLKKPITSFEPPKGMTRTRGTPQQTLTFLGGKVPFSNVSFDLGVTDGFIDVKSRTIKFTGGGQYTKVGTRLPEPTRGISLTHNPPSLLEQLVKRPKVRHETQSRRDGRTRIELTNVAAPKRPRGRLVSHGVYADRTGTRISRRPRRHWRRIY